MFFGKKHNIIINSFIGIASQAVIIITTQLVIYPGLAKRYTVDEYGTILTIIGIVSILNVTLGNSLNNIRLIQQDKYNNGKNGDFMPILIASCSFAGILMASVLLFLEIQKAMLFLMLIIYSMLCIIREYGMAVFRIELNFKRDFITNACMCVVMILISLISNYSLWPLIFLGAESAGLVYLLFCGGFSRETITITPLFSNTLKLWLPLMLTNLLLSAVSYMDRILIFPILGGTSVSIYNTAALPGKVLAMIFTPIAGVVLSYTSKSRLQFTNETILKIYLIVIGVACIYFIFGVFLFGDVLLSFLYPTIINYSNRYILMASLASILYVCADTIQTILLKQCPTYYYLILNLIYAILYIIIGVILTSRYSLWGFCISLIFVSLIRLIILYVIHTDALRFYDVQ